MVTKDFISLFTSLSDGEQKTLLRDLQRLTNFNDYESILKLRGDALDDKRSECPHCESSSYTKFGSDKGSRRYRCKTCLRTFTEYTGTWIGNIHKKNLIPEFLRTMEIELSLKKTSKKIKIDESTAFKWRHRFLSATELEESSVFKGITEVDETFFYHSQKGKECTHRQARKRGGRNSRGITNNEATVLTTMDREGNTAFEFSNMGRISKQEIEKSIGHRVDNRTILCSDGHHSYKAFTKSFELEHHILNASKGQRTKGVFHIQHVNSLHSRLKQFFNYQLKGVSTKYLQKYLNWQKIKDKFKDSLEWVKLALLLSLKQAKADKIYKNIEKNYLKIFNSTLNTC